MKYMGSKSRVAKDIVSIIQKCIDDNNIETYVEPFVGGANIIDKINCKNKIGNDLNKYLIGLLSYVSNNGELLQEVSRELYSEVRSNYLKENNNYEDWYVGNIGFLASYNGRWFDGGFAKPGYEKTKTGTRYRDYYKEGLDNLLKQKEKLKDIKFSAVDYKDIIIPNNSVIYCDPPYEGTTFYSNSIKFNYEEFWKYMRKISQDNYVFISEENAPDDFVCIWNKEVSRSIKATDKSKSSEKLFVYKEGKF